MIHVVIQGAGIFYHINKIKGGESLPLLAFSRHVVNVIFLEYLKEAGYSQAI